MIEPVPVSGEDHPVRFVRANGDKPHRCPRCHGIPQAIYDDPKGKARWWRTYRCDRGCNVRWWRGFAE